MKPCVNALIISFMGHSILRVYLPPNLHSIVFSMRLIASLSFASVAFASPTQLSETVRKLRFELDEADSDLRVLHRSFESFRAKHDTLRASVLNVLETLSVSSSNEDMPSMDEMIGEMLPERNNNHLGSTSANADGEVTFDVIDEIDQHVRRARDAFIRSIEEETVAVKERIRQGTTRDERWTILFNFLGSFFKAKLLDYRTASGDMKFENLYEFLKEYFNRETGAAKELRAIRDNGTPNTDWDDPNPMWEDEFWSFFDSNTNPFRNY